MKGATKYQVWVKTQRKYKNLQLRLNQESRHHFVQKLERKLDRLKRRLLEMNRKWKLGIATSTLLGWMTFAPISANAQLFPVQLSSSELDGSNGFKLSGESVNSQFGLRTSSAGDINGDGIDDFMVSAIRQPSDDFFEGKLYIVFGQKEAFDAEFPISSLDGTNGFTIINDFLSETGRSIASLGDINDDGIDDIAVADLAQSYVIFGKESFDSTLKLDDLDGSDGFVFQRYSSNLAVGSAGDINGDGINDVLLTEEGYNSNRGRCYVVFGKSTSFTGVFDLTTLDGTNGFTVTGIEANDRLGDTGSFRGNTATSAGDVNNDGIDDLLLAAPLASIPDQNGVGETYVIFGKSTFEESVDLTGLDGTNGFTVQGSSRYDRIGVALGAGDINGDGISDIVIGAPGVDVNDFGEGATYVVYGKEDFDATLSTAGLDGTNGFVINGIAQSDYSGQMVNTGDINGDGRADVMVGAFRRDGVGGEDSGAGYVLFGQENTTAAAFDLSDLDGNNGFVFEGANTFDYACRVASAGDINGDGIEDFIVGGESAGGDERSGNTGEAYVIFGRKNNVPTIATEIDPLTLEEGFGTSTVDLTATFVDADNDALVFSVTSSDPSVATVSLEGNILTITEVGLGTATISVTADDGKTGKVTESFEINVSEIPLGVRRSDFESLAVYPNPVTSGMVTVQFGERIRGKISVFSLNGNQVFSESVNSEFFKPLDLSQQLSGMYLIQIESVHGKTAFIRLMKK
ncbi:MAG: T9SS type A sorting domain-containing protein [Bacteroidota bacterium]